MTYIFFVSESPLSFVNKIASSSPNEVMINHNFCAGSNFTSDSPIGGNGNISVNLKEDNNGLTNTHVR